ncbi:MAG: metallophosphoesterase [Bacteroidaceae bacterium]|nr:metallophosphoesterase [Bacteroidaceae bacterium]
MGIMLILILVCFLCGNTYIFIRALQTISAAPMAIKISFGIIFWLLALQLFIVMALRHSNLPEFLPKIMFSIGTLWMVFVLYMTLALLAIDAVRLLINIPHSFLWALGITAAILTGGYINNLHPRVETIELKLDKKLEHPMTIVAVSDLHLGYGTGKAKLKKFVQMINAQNPDLIIIGGDLIDNSLIPLYNERMHEELCQLKAPMGIYMAPGNHEYISNIDESRRFLELTPIKMLADTVVTFPNGFQLILRDDRYAGRRFIQLKELLEKTDRERPIMVVKHQPRSLKGMDAQKADIVFCGHTHHGQIWPGNIATDIIFEQSHGYRKWSHSHIFVSSGLSLWGPPIRIGTKGDMAVFKISGQQNDGE